MRAPALVLTLAAGCAGAGPPVDGEVVGDTAACTAWTYADEPGAWDLPGGTAGTFALADREAADCDAGLPATRLLDVTGDDRPDIVEIANCADPDLGHSRWRVWPGADGGFGEDVDWALPEGFAAGAFGVSARMAADCTDGDLPAWFLADLSGDGRPDLVVTESCADPTLAAGAWRVHKSTGAGFAAGEVWTIGFPASNGAFRAPSANIACAEGVNVPAWGLVDIDGDGASDIVVTATCTGGTIGEREWYVLHSTGAGFAEGARWALPPGVRAPTLAEEAPACPTTPARFLVDLDGDARPELAFPQSCVTFGGDWTVYPNVGDGFSPLAETRWWPTTMASGISSRVRETPDCDRGIGAWMVEDVVGDAHADVTFATSCADPSVGDTRWELLVGNAQGWDARGSVPLPAGYSPESFRRATGDIGGCGGNTNRPAWVRADLDGDGMPEIVVTAACDDPSIGNATWRVHPLTCSAR